MSYPSELLDEFFNINNPLDKNPLDFIGEDYEDYEDFEDYEDYDGYEENEDCGEYELSDNDERDICQERGTSFCKFDAASYPHFLKFYNYLSNHGYEKMVLRDPKRYKVEVYGLTKVEADLLTKKYLELRRFMSQKSRGQVA